MHSEDSIHIVLAVHVGNSAMLDWIDPLNRYRGYGKGVVPSGQELSKACVDGGV